MSAAVALTERLRECYKIKFQDGGVKPTVRSYGAGARLPS
jgi:hypothetical protein